jgi:hypothetical protein
VNAIGFLRNAAKFTLQEWKNKNAANKSAAFLPRKMLHGV